MRNIIRFFMLFVVAGAAIAQQPEQPKTDQPKAEQPKPIDPYTAIRSYEQGKDRRPWVAINTEISKASPENYLAIEKKLLDALADQQTTQTSKSLICKTLARIASKESVPAMAALLTTDKHSHDARIVLEIINDPAADDALRTALSKTTGDLRLGVISSVAARRDVKAIPLLEPLISSGDTKTSLAAINAIAQINTPAAAKSIGAAMINTPEALSQAVANAGIDLAAHLVTSGHAKEAREFYSALAAAQWPPVRFAANAGLLATTPADKQPQAIAEILGDDDTVIRAAALSIVRDNKSSALAESVVALIPKLKPDSQAQSLAILIDRDDLKLRPLLVQLLASSKELAVRAIALEAMTRFAEADDIPMLASIAAKPAPASPAPDEPALARRVLEQRNAPGFAAALVKQVEAGESASRVVLIKVLTARIPTEIPNLLLTLANDKDTPVRSEALSSLGAIGQPAQLDAILDIIKTATDDAVRNAAVDSASRLCARQQDKNNIDVKVLAAIEKSPSAAASAAFIKILAQIGNTKSFNALKPLVTSQTPEIKDAAIRALSDWPRIVAADPLLEIARTSTSTTHKVLAIRGYVRLARTVDQAPEKRLDMLKNAMAVAPRADEKKLVIAGLADVPTAPSLAILRAALKEDALKDEAAASVVKVAAGLGAMDSSTARAALNEVKAITKREDLLKQIDDALKSIDALAGCITHWKLAGPFKIDGKEGLALMDVPLGPELADAKVEWTSPVVPTKAENVWQIELLKKFNGNNRVAYAKCSIYSSKAQPALLELGSDDGIKVILNGKTVFMKNQVRQFRAGQDKVKIDLQQGENTILVKVTQNGGDWMFSARLRNPEGGVLEGMSVTK